MRNPYFDFLRGIAIIMVVSIHTYINNGQISLFVRQLLNCAVPLFLAISGYFMSQKDISSKANYKAFLKKQLSRVYVPCLIWSLPLCLLNIYSGVNAVYSVVLMFICGYSIYYFIALIMQYYILLPFLKNVKIRGVLLSAIVSLSCITIYTYSSAYYSLHLPLIYYAAPFPIWIVFFVLGLYLGNINNRKYNVGFLFLICLFFLASSYLEARFILNKFSIPFPGIKPSAFLYSIIVLLISFSNKVQSYYVSSNSMNKIVALLGRYSFGVYLIHCFVIQFFRTINWYTNFWIINLFMVLCGSVIIIWLVVKFTPLSVHKVLGFK